MPDLNTALARHLADHTPGAVAPFAEVRQRARRRTRTRAAVGALAAVLVLAGATVFTVIGSGRTSTPPPAAPPELITVNGKQLRLKGEADIGNVWIDPSDRSALVVEAGYDAPRKEGTHCMPYTVAQVLGQDRSTVRIAAYAYEPAETPPPNSGCTAEGYPAKRHVLELGAPLDGRTVVHG